MRLATALALLLAASAAMAATIHVPGDQPTIQAGIDFAAPGDTVLVAAGTFTGPGNKNLWLAKDLTLLSESGANATIIDCEGIGRGLLVTGTKDTSVRGFTIRNGNTEDSGGAVLCLSASPTFSECLLDSNVGRGTLGSGGGAIFCVDSGPTFEWCTVSNNQNLGEGSVGGGVSLMQCQTVTFSDCFFENNSALTAGLASGGGGLVSYQDTNVLLLRCIFRDNAATVGGGALFVNTVQATVEDTEFSRNRSVTGSGGGLAATATPITMTRCVFDRNEGVVGGAFEVAAAQAIVEWCTLYGNRTDSGAVFRISVGPTAIVTHTVLAWNLAESSGCPGPVEFQCCDIFGNLGGDWIGCIADQAHINGNFSADPLFCDAEGGDFTLSSQSPCLPGNHPDGADCGLIGALGEGCGPVSVEQESWAGIKMRYKAAGP